MGNAYGMSVFLPEKKLQTLYSPEKKLENQPTLNGHTSTGKKEGFINSNKGSITTEPDSDKNSP